METIKIGAITVGQAPRTDVTADIMGLLGDNIELIERGGLDCLTAAEIAEFAPHGDDYVLVSRLKDGTSVTFGEKYIFPRLQAAIDDLISCGCKLIMFFCTGDFHFMFQTTVPLIFPGKLLEGVVPSVTSSGKIAVVTPSALQLEQSRAKWEKYVPHAVSFAASPYGEIGEIEAVADELAKADCDLIVLDCIGYTCAMKQIVAQKTGKNVVLPRTFLARVIHELLEA